ncbi:UNVERIFIED_CONTAM: hypothetical protein Slati_0169500 [Sesamum latifolium]|uniref:Uncharacterized protein n=1 Tax=Sesamum latifolium TaxID=2727402 RepID=A0AAW2YAN8_9LAMI
MVSEPGSMWAMVGVLGRGSQIADCLAVAGSRGRSRLAVRSELARSHDHATAAGRCSSRSWPLHAAGRVPCMLRPPVISARIILDFENQGYILDKPLPEALPDGSSLEERLTFEKWHEDNRKVRSIILASMTNEIQKQYDRLDDVPLIMLRMKEVYAVPDRYIRYAATKALFRTKMAEGSSVQSHGVKMLSLQEKLEDLKAGLDNDTYIDVILQSLP